MFFPCSKNVVTNSVFLAYCFEHLFFHHPSAEHSSSLSALHILPLPLISCPVQHWDISPICPSAHLSCISIKPPSCFLPCHIWHPRESWLKVNKADDFSHSHSQSFLSSLLCQQQEDDETAAAWGIPAEPAPGMYPEPVAQGRSCCGWQSSHPCSSFFVCGSTLLLPREEGECRVGELCLPDLAWILLHCSAPVPPAAPGCLSLSSVLSKSCLAKKLWAGKWCHHDNLFHTSLSQLSESVPLLGTWMTSLLRQGRCPHNSVPTVFDKVLSKVCRKSEVLLWFKCSTIPSVLQLLITMCLIQLCPPLLPWKAQWNLNFAKEGVHVSSSMREIVPAVVSILIATKASLEENISPSPLADNFIDLFLSHYVLYASVVCILYSIILL